MSNKLDFREWKLNSSLSSSLQLKVLKARYDELTLNLTKSRCYESLKTLVEGKVLSDLKAHTRLHVWTSVWIGNHSLDLFIPSLAGRGDPGVIGYNGLAIEVDGSVHDLEYKIRKDHRKIDKLKKLGIAVYSISNHDLREETYRAFLRNLQSQKRLDTRARNRLLRNIYIYTLAVHLKDDEISDTFGEENVWIFSKMRRSI